MVKNSLSDLYQSRISLDSCDEHGILNTTSFMTASIAATQAIKILLNEEHEKDLIRFNIWNNTFDKIKIKSEKRKKIQVIKLCRNSYSVNLNKKLDLNMLSKKYKTLLKNNNILVINDKNRIVINGNGYIIFEDTNEEEVKKWLKFL